MIPNIGPVSNSGSMPLDMGSAGPSSVTSTNTIGGFQGARVNFGGSGATQWLMLLMFLALAWVVFKK
ncbi:hypothetical protein [Enterovibrio paralichthyis]|uniref:hypothetical protein n=1 Tax=Enterovibrio paralichthyis TaxID=2853805 RepID=UPI001C470FF4|nr:hypothetical protein [Enterovibrio paralichthyis]MBV7296824.1 hypothetical protein [Enterovibrio paralichthyis]